MSIANQEFEFKLLRYWMYLLPKQKMQGGTCSELHGVFNTFHLQRKVVQQLCTTQS